MPSIIGIPTVVQESETSTLVVVSWDKPDIRGSEITAYEVQFKDVNGDFQTVTDLCDGSIESIVLARSC